MNNDAKLKTFTPTDCAVCNAGSLITEYKTRPALYLGHEGQVRSYFGRCSNCNTVISTAEHLLENKREMIRFRKSVSGIPDGATILRLRKKLRLKQAAAGAIIGGGPVAFSKYENDDLIPDEAMHGLLLLLIDNPNLIHKLEKLKRDAKANTLCWGTSLPCIDTSTGRPMQQLKKHFWKVEEETHTEINAAGNTTSDVEISVSGTFVGESDLSGWLVRK